MEKVYDLLLPLANCEVENSGVKLKIERFWGKIKVTINAPAYLLNEWPVAEQGHLGDNIETVLETMTGISELITKLKKQANRVNDREKPDYWLQCELQNHIL